MRIHLLLLILAAVIGVAVPVSALSQVTPEQAAAVDKLFADWDKPDSPGAAVGVIRDGELIYKKGYGTSDLEHDVPLTSKSVFYMASVSKQFVTMAILLLEEQGKLGLDDEIQKYFPDFPRYDGPLTIRNFIHHTSGVRDNLTLWNLSGRDIYDQIDVDEMYQMIRRQKELNFTPGDRYLYSNSCYFMLAQIVEKVSGMPIKEFAEKEMFGPLGMKDTHFHDDQYHIVKDRVFSYAPGKDGYRNLIMRFDLVGSGGLYSNVEDLLKWDRNFYANKLGKGRVELVRKMEEEGLLNDGTSTGYAFGLSNGTHKGLRTVGHSGGLAGYSTYMIRYPDQKFSVIVLANLQGFNSGGKAREIAEIFLKDEFKPETPSASTGGSGNEPEPEVELSEEHLKKFVGHFWSAEETIFVKIYLEDGKPIFEREGVPPMGMKALSENSFRVLYPNVDVVVTFSGSTDGRRSYKAVVNREASIDFVSYEPAEYSENELRNLAGTYYSEEINAYYKLAMEDGKLSLLINDRDTGTLEPVMKGLFRNNAVGLFAIEADAKGTATGFRLDAGRVRNLRFEKR